MSENDDLVTSEGVDEGSAASTDESNEGRGVAGALAAASETGRPAEEYDPAPPLEQGLPQTRSDDGDKVGPGQELNVGEG